METFLYKPVQLDGRNTANDTESKPFLLTKPFLRQVLVCSGLWMGFFLAGVITGAPTVIIPQIRKEANSTKAISDGEASWLTSALGIIGIPWVLLLPLLIYFIGRKLTFIMVAFFMTIGFIVFYCSTTIAHLFICEALVAALYASNITLSPAIVTECVSPQYRGSFLAIKSASFYWGIWVSNAIGTFFPWKTISWVFFVGSCYILTVFYWPESPYWLAIRGRYEESAAAHRWLKGTGKDAERELEFLMKSQQKYNCKKTMSILSKEHFISLLKTISYPELYKPLLLGNLLILLNYASGKMVCMVYAIDIFKKITKSESEAYKTMLILDGVTVFSMYVGSFICRYLRRRVLLLSTSFLEIIFLLLLSLYLYLIRLSVLEENHTVSITILILYTLSVSCGPLILTTSILGELLPIQFKSTALFISGLFFALTHALSIKIAPQMFRSFSLHGAFLFYGLLSLICTLILFKYLPETKEKTLQEIEQYFKSNLKQVEDRKSTLSLTTNKTVR